jgi:hypothetical protein
LTLLDFICRDSASEIKVSSSKSLTVAKLQANNIKDEDEIASMLYQDVGMFYTVFNSKELY